MSALPDDPELVASLAAVLLALAALVLLALQGWRQARDRRRFMAQVSSTATNSEKALAAIRMLAESQQRLDTATEESSRALERQVEAGVNQVQTRINNVHAALNDRLAGLSRLVRPEPPALTSSDMTTPGKLAMSALEFDGESPSVVLLLHAYEPSGVFAGIRTAVLSAVELAARMKLPLRVVIAEPVRAGEAATRSALADLIRLESRHPQISEQLRLSAPNFRDHRGHHRDDVWLATFWPTAWALGPLIAEGRVRRERVVYLVQDWEPAFYPWSENYARALDTYNYGFRMVVNSRPLWQYVQRQTGVAISERRVFGPQLDREPLSSAAARWKPDPDGALRLLFYARPSKPRNMLRLGLQAIEHWAASLADDATVVVRLAGEAMGDVSLQVDNVEVHVLGKVSYDAYYDLLAETDFGLALMYSPHPGHLALELPMAGIPTVTNPFENYRETWIEGLTVARTSTAEDLAAALGQCAEVAGGLAVHQPGRDALTIGGSLSEAIADVADEIEGSQTT